MSDHLPPEKLELLANYRLRGKELSAALEHIENCAECRGKMPPPRVEDILRRLEATEDEPETKQAEPVNENESFLNRFLRSLKNLFRGKGEQ